jgi:hypothetical protein
MFLCPEAAAGEGYSAFAADLWAAGVTLYILLFGSAPFGRGCRDPEALFEAIRNQPLGVLPWDRALKVGGDLHTAPADAPHEGGGSRASFGVAGGRASFSVGGGRASFSVGGGGAAAALPRASFNGGGYGGDGSAKAEATDLLRRLLAKDPERRLRSAEELLAHPFLRVAYDAAAGEEEEAGAAGGASPPLLQLRREAIPPIDVSRLPPYVTPEMAMHGVVEEPSGGGDGGGGGGGGERQGTGVVIVREGWLLKQGKNRKTWKRRFFRLTAEGQLHYWNEKPAAGAPAAGGGGALKSLASWVRDFAGGGTGEGVVQLSAAAHMVRSPKPGMPWRIVVGAKERLLKLQAESEADAEAWDRAMRVFTSAATAAAADFLQAAEID